VPPDGTLGLRWTSPDFDDAAWAQGSMGIGFDLSTTYDPHLRTDLESRMYRTSATVYLRQRFAVSDPSAYASIILRMKYDDGYVAYLNGTRVAARNDPPAPAWDSSAARAHTDSEAIRFESVLLTGSAALLRPGWNVLAIHGMNAFPGSNDMLIASKLDAVTASDGSVVILEKTTQVRARARVEDAWSVLTEAAFRIARPLDALRITEIMYHPPEIGADDGDACEFIELKNTGHEDLDLTAVRFSGGVGFAFAEGTLLLPGAFALLVADSAAFRDRYPDVDDGLVKGTYRGRLSNAGEVLALVDAAGSTITTVPFDDQPPWPVDADGFGPSLVPVDRDARRDQSEPSSWRASALPGGSPGEDDRGYEPTGGRQRPGDFSQDGRLTVSDAVTYLRYLFGRRPVELPCGEQSAAEGGNLLLLDVNGDAAVDVADPVYLLTYLFLSGPPAVQGPECIRIPGCPDACMP
jgi:hypothetical protein